MKIAYTIEMLVHLIQAHDCISKEIPSKEERDKEKDNKEKKSSQINTKKLEKYEKYRRRN